MNYSDTQTVVQIIGNVFLDPALLDDARYKFSQNDFPQNFHRVVFGAIYNLYRLGTSNITAAAIEDYLKTKPKSYAVFNANKGMQYLENLTVVTRTNDFLYHYKRLKKLNLLQAYDNIGVDVSDLYNPDNLDYTQKQKQEEWLDITEVEDIADIIDKRIESIKIQYSDTTNLNFKNAGHNIDQLIDSLIQEPQFGYPLYGKYINTITRGARLKKLYLRSAPSGVGKTRALIADACNFACDEIWDKKTARWVQNGSRQPTLYITTEQEISEIQTMMLAFVSGVDEQHILTGRYINIDEEKRVRKAADILKIAPIHVKQMPDFTMKDIQNNIKYAVREFGVKYVAYDYLHSSIGILSEVSGKSGIAGLREDNVLFMIAVKLKDICNQYNVFIITSTQLNGGWQTAEVYDQNLLRGAKSIADKIDYGCIMLPVTKQDKEVLEPMLGNNTMPDTKIAVYKNRRGRYKDILVWCVTDKSTCHIDPVFITDYSYELLKVQDTKLEVINEH